MGLSVKTVLTVVGARPQFIKAAMVSRAIASGHSPGELIETIIHTGQHYDANMSDLFFAEMAIPAPAVTLEFGGLSHGAMTGRLLEALEKEIVDGKPDVVLVYGDTNSTLAGALAAAKCHVPVAHVEAGLRSFNRAMPEEINRVLTDHVSSFLFCPTGTAVQNLEREGIAQGVHHVGDVMFDAALVFGELADKRSSVLADLGLRSGCYRLATVHRAENTDAPHRLRSIFAALSELATDSCPMILPLHPRTARSVERIGGREKVAANKSLRLIDPVGFLDMVQLEKNAQLILTDSGGVQKEAYFHGVPCVTLRDETEWVETVKAGWNQIAGAETATILEAVESAGSGAHITEYGEGNASEHIVEHLLTST